MTIKISEKVKWCCFILIYIGFILLLSFKPPAIQSHSFVKEVINNLAHIPLYLILGHALFVLFRHLRTGKKASIYTIICGMLIGVLDEFFQSFIPGRIVSGMDLMLDLAGICLAILLFKVIRVRNKQRRKQIRLGETGEVL